MYEQVSLGQDHKYYAEKYFSCDKWLGILNDCEFCMDRCTKFLLFIEVFYVSVCVCIYFYLFFASLWEMIKCECMCLQINEILFVCDFKSVNERWKPIGKK